MTPGSKHNFPNGHKSLEVFVSFADLHHFRPRVDLKVSEPLSSVAGGGYLDPTIHPDHSLEYSVKRFVTGQHGRIKIAAIKIRDQTTQSHRTQGQVSKGPRGREKYTNEFFAPGSVAM